MSKQTKRKITVNISNKSKALPKSRPSVFERLGTKAGSTHKEICHHWAQHGTCPYGKSCKYSSTHTLISPSKQRAAKKENESKKRHSKESHKRLHSSNIKVAHSPEEEWNQWDPTALEAADPADLEKRRQELQRELELQMKMENKARKKEKKLKRESSPSTESSSSSSESSSSSDDSSSSSSSSVETTRRKKKKIKAKPRVSSSSSDHDHSRKHKLKTSKHGPINLKTSRLGEKSKKASPPKTVVKIITKSPTPARTFKKSQTPPPKLKAFIPVKKALSRSKSPRPSSTASDHKEKHRTPSPKVSKEKEKEKERDKEKLTREREREREKEREREREREKDKEREREKEKEREREREKEKEREREKERDREREKAREREKEREKEKEQKKRDIRSPRRDSKSTKDPKRKESPESRHSRDRKLSPSRSRGSGSGSSRRDNSRKSSPTSKDDRRSDKKEDYDRSKVKDRTADKTRKDKRDSRDRDRERERERERERRIAREEREAAREKEREEALARCQERQRERERLKEMAKKEEERRNRDRTRREDRGLDKPSGDRVERLLPLPADRVPPSRRGRSSEKERTERERTRDVHRDRSSDRSRSRAGKSVDRHDRLERDADRTEHTERDRSDRVYDRNYDRSERNYDRDPERERDREREYASLSSRLRDSERRHDDKSYDSPYDRVRHEDRRYLELEERYNENSRDDRLSLDAREYPDDRRSHRDLWEEREVERERELEQRRYGRENSRPPSLKGREWDPLEYAEHEWDRARRPPLDWEGRGVWDNREHDHIQLEEEWRHYNRSLDSWATEERRRWPEWRDRSRPRSAASHRDDEISDIHKRELPKQEMVDSVKPEMESKKDTALGKRSAEQCLDNVVDAKKLCLKEPPLEDDLSEISDDADEILNREEDPSELPTEEEHISLEGVANKIPEKEMQETQSIAGPASSQKSQSPNRTPNRLTKDESMDDENMDLDFEEISEDELEEETRVKGLGDALGVDWASLVAESRPRVKPMCSAKRRWESHNILVNLGVSVEMAGEELVKDILREHAEAKLKGEQDAMDKVKTMESNDGKSNSYVGEANIDNVGNEINGKMKSDTKVNLKGSKLPEASNIEISHPVATIQVSLREKEAIRKSLFASAGPYRRALSARRDLVIRRHLCNLPIKDMYAEGQKRHDPELLKQAMQLFERCL